MTTPVDVPLLAIRTQEGNPNYKPLTDAKRKALKAFYDVVNAEDSYRIEDLHSLIEQGLGADIMHFVCAGPGPKLHASLAKSIAIADINLDPLLENAEGVSILKLARDRADAGPFSTSFDSTIALMQQRVDANRKQAAVKFPGAVTPKAAAPVAAPAVAEVVAPEVTASAVATAAATEKPLTIVEQARLNAAKLRAAHLENAPTREPSSLAEKFSAQIKASAGRTS